jgi:hypothetical protein
MYKRTSNFRFGFSELGFVEFLRFGRIDFEGLSLKILQKSILWNPINPTNPNSEKPKRKLLQTHTRFNNAT